jgi:DNA primase
MQNRDELIKDCRLAQTTIGDTTEIDKEIEELNQEMAVAAELSRRAIQENARSKQNQREFKERNDKYLDRLRTAKEKVDALESERSARIGKALIIEHFIRDISKRPLILEEFDEKLWNAVIEKATVQTDGTMTFCFKDGTEITV